MSYTIVPLPTGANANFAATLDNEQATINLTTTDYGLFADVTYNGVAICTGSLCLDRVDLNRARYLGMPQALFFADTQGTSDPTYDGFNSRYLLVYGDPSSNGGTAVA